jgi:HSP20 family protein
VSRQWISRTLEDHVLTIKGSRKLDATEKEQISLGRAYGDFELSYTLPDVIDSEQLQANLADGVLTIRIGKHPKAQPRQIQIGDGSQHKQLGE